MTPRELDELLAADPFAAALLAAGRLRRDAHALAEAEEAEGGFVEEEPDDVPLRLAAQDGGRVWASGLIRVELRPEGLVQTAGPAGLSLDLGGVQLPLVPDVLLPIGSAELPDTLTVVDRHGRRHVLR